MRDKQELLTISDHSYQVSIDLQGKHKLFTDKQEYLGFASYCPEMKAWFGQTRDYVDPLGLEKALCKIKYFETKQECMQWLIDYAY